MALKSFNLLLYFEISIGVVNVKSDLYLTSLTSSAMNFSIQNSLFFKREI